MTIKQDIKNIQLQTKALRDLTEELQDENRQSHSYHLRIYDFLRQFHKNELFEIMDKYEKELKEDSRYKEALETLSGVLYLCESVFAREG